MIKVYNRTTNYLRVDGKSIAPLKTEEFEERTPQIRVLERNGSITISENLDKNIIPHSDIKEEVKEEPVIKVEDTPVTEEVIEEVKEEKVEEPIKEDVVEIEEEAIIPEEEAKNLEENEVQEVEAEEVVVKKTTKKRAKSKKGGNK